MTLDEIVEQVSFRTRDVEGVEQYPISRWVNIWYTRIHQQIPNIPETLVEQSFTWATTDGTSKDMADTTGVTNWRGMPDWINSTDSDDKDYDWIRVARMDIRDSGSATVSGVTRFAVQGKNIIINSAFTTDTTVYMAHFRNPTKLTSDDEPLLPAAYHQILVDAAVQSIWASIRAHGTRRYERMQRSQEEIEAANSFTDAWNALIGYVKRERRVNYRIRPGAIWSQALIQKSSRDEWI